MSFLSRLFGGSQAAIEREVRNIYTQMLCNFCGYTSTQAEQAMSEAIATCKQQGKSEGTADLPKDYGNLLVVAARMGEPKSQRIVERARREGATDDDIKEWWNLPDLCRRMVLWSENTFRYAAFLHAVDEDGLGLSDESAAARVHKMFPFYGDPEDTSKLAGDNRPLPHELRGRVDMYKQAHDAQYVADQVKNFPSYNAFVRHAIQRGLI